MKKTLLICSFLLSFSVAFAQTEDISKQLCDCGSNSKELKPIFKTFVSNYLTEKNSVTINSFLEEMKLYPEAEAKKILKELRSKEVKKVSKDIKKCTKVIKPMYQKLSDTDKATVDAKVMADENCAFALTIIKKQIKKQEDKKKK